MFFPAAPQRAHQYVQNAWEWDKHDLKVSRDPAGCLALHSRREHDKDPLLGGKLFLGEPDGLLVCLQVTFILP